MSDLVLISATTCAYDLATISSLLTMMTRSPTFSPARLAGPPSFTSLTKIVSIGESESQAPAGGASSCWRLSFTPVIKQVNDNRKLRNTFGHNELHKANVAEGSAPLLLWSAASHVLSINHSCLPVRQNHQACQLQTQLDPLLLHALLPGNYFLSTCIILSLFFLCM